PGRGPARAPQGDEPLAVPPARARSDGAQGAGARAPGSSAQGRCPGQRRRGPTDAAVVRSRSHDALARSSVSRGAPLTAEAPGAAAPSGAQRPVLVVASPHEIDELVRELKDVERPVERILLRDATPGRVLALEPAVLVLAVAARGYDPLCRAIRA